MSLASFSRKFIPASALRAGLLLLAGLSFLPAHGENRFTFGDVKELKEAAALESAVYASLPESHISRFEHFYLLRLVAVGQSGNPALAKHYFHGGSNVIPGGIFQGMREFTPKELTEAFIKAHAERAAKALPDLDNEINAARETRKIMGLYRELSEEIAKTAALTSREVPEDVIARKYIKSKLEAFKVTPHTVPGHPDQLELTFRNETGNLVAQSGILHIIIWKKGEEVSHLRKDKYDFKFDTALNPGEEHKDIVPCDSICQEVMNSPDFYSEIHVDTLNGHPAGSYRFFSFSAGHEWDSQSSEDHLNQYLSETLPALKAAIDKTAGSFAGFVKETGGMAKSSGDNSGGDKNSRDNSGKTPEEAGESNKH
ncbi:hypothetical protein [Succinimonas sp.]|uniref:hypothetical protein n=1 Tax=Succinimonas sp. TaxID=1936151 RepID=UPI00386F2B70